MNLWLIPKLFSYASEVHTTFVKKIPDMKGLEIMLSLFLVT